MKKVKKDAYQEVTNIVVAQLEQAIEDRKASGKTGWTKPWVDTTAGLQLSYAPLSKLAATSKKARSVLMWSSLRS